MAFAHSGDGAQLGNASAPLDAETLEYERQLMEEMDRRVAEAAPRQPHFGLKEPKPPAAKRKPGAQQYHVIKPNTFGELQRVAQKLTNLPGKLRVFVDGGGEITTERQYEAVEPGDVLIVVDARGKKVDLTEALRRHSLQEEGGESRARMELPQQAPKLVKFTALSDYQEHFVKHEGVAVNRPCAPKGRLVEPVPRTEQLKTAEEMIYQPRHPWWKAADFSHQSESASAYVQQEIQRRDAKGNSRKNLVSDFKLFAHRSNEPDAKLMTEKKSESQNFYTEFSKEEIDQCKGIEAAGVTVEGRLVTKTRTVPVDRHEAWWKDSPFEFTSESRAHFKHPNQAVPQGMCKNAVGENKECWDPEMRIGVETGTLASRRSSVNSGPI